MYSYRKPVSNNQSCNQIQKVPISPTEARLSFATAESVLYGNIEETVW